jgi:hypothetical protein
MPADLPEDLAKEAVKEALKEWLDAQFATFGRWTVAGLASAALVGAVWLALNSLGWRR